MEKMAKEMGLSLDKVVVFYHLQGEAEKLDKESRRSNPEEAATIGPAVQRYVEENPTADRSSKEIARILGFLPKQGNLTRISKTVKALTDRRAA
jgi:hypothetical protein